MPSGVLILGATSGIALAFARLLATQGARFFLVARNAEKLNAVSMDLKTRGAESVESRVVDLDDTSLHAALLAEAAGSLGFIDLAFLAHGVLGSQPESEASFAKTAAVFQTNLLSPVSLITWLSNYFEAAGQGTLAVLSSVAGDRGRKSNYIYGSTKSGLNAFLDGVRNRVDRCGVHVLTIRPGYVTTPMTAHLKPNILFATPNRAAKAILRAILSKRDIVYIPAYWSPIMFVVRSIPGSIFKKLDF